jgi:hypothetical protein
LPAPDADDPPFRSDWQGSGGTKPVAEAAQNRIPTLAPRVSVASSASRTITGRTSSVSGSRLALVANHSVSKRPIWRSLRTTNATERLHQEFNRRIEAPCLPPCAETADLLFWALLASGQITWHRVDGWPTLDRSPVDLDLAA